MKKILSSLFLLPLMVNAGEKIDEQRDVVENGTIVIENPRGDVVIKTWDQSKFSISGELDDKAEGFELSTKGNVTSFSVIMPKQRSSWKNGDNSQLVVHMPKQSELRFEGINGNVKADNLLAGAYIKTVNGDINVSNITGKVSLETVNGDLTSQELSGNIRFGTVNGNIEDVNSSGKLRFNAVNGDIESHTKASDIRLENVNGEVEFTLAEINELRLSTVSGEVDISIEKLATDANLNLESVSGEISLAFASPLSARFEVDAHAGGSIRNKLSSDKVKKAKYGPSRELEFVVGDGDASVEIDTVSGRIELEKKQ